jgi:hypothetical protein
MRQPACARLVLCGTAIAGFAASQAVCAQSYEITETREPCASHDPLRQPFFGDLHIHTRRSFDSYLFENRNDARDAYAFAKGSPILLAPLDAQGNMTRELVPHDELDFAAVTDHSELFGETAICTTPSHPLYNAPACNLYRTNPTAAFVAFGSALGDPVPTRQGFCGPNGTPCLNQAGIVWSDLQAAAEQHYDRSSACDFTTFIAYEWSRSPDGNTLHRNVFFRNENVPALPISTFEQSTPEGLWSALQSGCLDAGTGCDVLAIPHNPNLSNGRTFDPLGSDGLPMTEAEAQQRAALEPLVELLQHKGASECRTGVDTTDELCDFEIVETDPAASDEPLNYVRNALKRGLVLGRDLGTNPFELGFVGATDTHNAIPGATEEGEFVGHVGNTDDTVVQQLNANLRRFSPGGLTVLYAEENARDSLFAAMRRRESYATSGTRPVVRFFGGYAYPSELCSAPDFVAQGYAGGVPMGGRLGASLRQPPRFAVSALMDPGTPETPGTPLQRIQIVKGWLDAAGATHEAVFDVAGSANNGASVDAATCATSGTDSASLCAVWQDPDFDASEPAFYYARVLENPTCRWSQRACLASGVNCSAGAPPGFEACCDGSIPATLQERALTSPIWHVPVPPLPAARPWSLWLLAAGLPFAAIGALAANQYRAR